MPEKNHVVDENTVAVVEPLGAEREIVDYVGSETKGFSYFVLHRQNLRTS